MAKVVLTKTPKQINSDVAHLAGVRRTLKKQADRMAGIAKGVLSEHRKTGQTEITVTKGTKLDYFVNLEDKDHTKGSPAAGAIEFGHMTRGGKWVEGIHALTRSFK